AVTLADVFLPKDWRPIFRPRLCQAGFRRSPVPLRPEKLRPGRRARGCGDEAGNEKSATHHFFSSTQRKPSLSFLASSDSPRREAERTMSAGSANEPPRMTRVLVSGLSQALPSPGASL